MPEHSPGRLPRAAGWEFRHGWIVLFLLLVAPLYLELSQTDGIGQLGTDGPAYLSMAEHYAGNPGADPVRGFVAATSRFPPVYPLLLAWGGGAVDLLRAHRLTAACFMAAMVALYGFLRVLTLPARGAAVGTLVFALMPGSWLLQMIIQSEYLYLCWSLLALSLMIAGERSRNPEWCYGAALALTLAVLTRAIGVTLFIPFLFAIRSLRRREAVMALLIALLPILLWRGLHQSRLDYGHVLTGMVRELGWKGLLLRLPLQMQALRVAFADNLLRHDGLRPLADGVGLVCIIATAARVKWLKRDALYLLAYAGVVLMWPFPEEDRRFVWVVLPLLLIQPLMVIVDVESTEPEARSRRLRRVAMLWGAALAAMLVPSLVFAAGRWQAALDEQLPEARFFPDWYGASGVEARQNVERDLILLGALQAIPGSVPPDDCVVTTRPDLITYFGRRIAVLPAYESTPESSFKADLHRSGCHYVFGLWATNDSYPEPMYPLARVQAYAVPIFMSSMPGARPGTANPVGALAKLDPSP